ncbi:MAG: ATP-binding protein [Clostridiales bacterium]|nr:ATP-binding protein [Clostridiales bacterium]
MREFAGIQKILGYARRACTDYGMIESGDRIAVGVSGGKDSLTLLVTLALLKRFYGAEYELFPVTLDAGFPGAGFSNIQLLCDQLGLTLTMLPSDVYEIVFNIRKEKFPCSLCANMRRGALNSAAVKLGCNKVALGHHFDDTVETLMMNLLIEGRFGCFSPVTYLDRSGITMIRPLIYCPEKEITAFIRKNGIEPSPKYCPADGNTKRAEIKKLLADMSKNDRGLKVRLFGALERSGVDGWSVHERHRKTKSEAD